MLDLLPTELLQEIAERLSQNLQRPLLPLGKFYPTQDESLEGLINLCMTCKAIFSRLILQVYDIIAPGYHTTPLVLSAKRGLSHLVTQLLDRGDDVDKPGVWFGHALTAASFGGHIDSVKLLVNFGADVNCFAVYYGTPLIAAAYQRQVNVVEFLLLHGADPYLKTPLGNTTGVGFEIGDGVRGRLACLLYSTSLHAAAAVGCHQIVHLLLRHGAAQTTQDLEGGDAPCAAILGLQNDIFDTLVLSGANVNARAPYLEDFEDPDGEFAGAPTILQVAASQGDEKSVLSLLQKGADVNASPGVYGTALYASIENSQIDVSRVLLEHGADVNMKGGHCGMPIHMAARNGDAKLTRLLLDHGASVNLAGPKDWHSTALFTASGAGHAHAVKLLLEAGADVNHESHNDFCPLSNAIQENTRGLGYRGRIPDPDRKEHVERIMRLLIQAGADINKRYEDDTTILIECVRCGFLETAKLLLDRGADVNAVHAAGYGALHIACESLDEPERAVQLLLDAGAKVDNFTGHGTPLQIALIKANEPTVLKLLDAGAALNVWDDRKGHLVYSASERGYTRAVKKLIELGASVQGPVGRSFDALRIASQMGHQEVLQLLLNENYKKPEVQVQPHEMVKTFPPLL